MRHCRYCGNTGHNRRTCPQRSPEVKKADQEYHSKYRRNNRRCGYCSNFGHDKRKCAKRKDDRTAWIAENAEFRKRFIEDCKQYGYGVGCVIGNTQDNQQYLFVKSINWDAITVGDSWNYALRAINMSSGNEISFSSPSFFGKSGDDRDISKSYYNYHVVTKADVTNIEKSLPTGWLDGMTDNFPSYLR